MVYIRWTISPLAIGQNTISFVYQRLGMMARHRRSWTGLRGSDSILAIGGCYTFRACVNFDRNSHPRIQMAWALGSRPGDGQVKGEIPQPSFVGGQGTS